MTILTCTHILFPKFLIKIFQNNFSNSAGITLWRVAVPVPVPAKSPVLLCFGCYPVQLYS